MKKFIVFILLICVLLYFTNPSKTEYTRWQSKQLQENKEGFIPEKLVSWMDQDVIDYRTTEVDYKLFSFYETKFSELGLEPIKAIGLFTIFLSIPSSMNIYRLGEVLFSIGSFVAIILILFIVLRIVRFIFKIGNKKEGEMEL
ncbi:hypothetical protein [Bacillus suaedaesalsae]|uniref:Uncharacterized protein n=1 Tax=Bacillus suaedaesalsae TaxID=2810349 RepID=A0ABS2DDN0_9BACI|nr:hypothetical protein [Bacillus suaedaesalsae]MBM6616557.1 hypothetical protein [Bacillus suaedaesalsae]